MPAPEKVPPCGCEEVLMLRKEIQEAIELIHHGAPLTAALMLEKVLHPVPRA